MLFDKYAYVPLMRTRDAEMKGFSQLGGDVKNSCLPCWELTKSRISKNNPNGDVAKTLDKLRELMGDREFILDVTTIDQFANVQTESLLDPDGGFKNWIKLLDEIEDLEGLIPVFHLVNDMTDEEFLAQWRGIAEISDKFAIRISPADLEVVELFELFVKHEVPLERCILLIDSQFIEPGSHLDHDDLVNDFIEALPSEFSTAHYVIMSSSVPSNISKFGDKEGAFELSEVGLTSLIQDAHQDLSITHGDYASIHPIKYEASFGNWVPRVDYPLADLMFFYRVRREAGGYEEAAKLVFNDPRYDDIGSWGNSEIEAAALGSANGKSPAYWIGVRVNLHITRQVQSWSS